MSLMKQSERNTVLMAGLAMGVMAVSIVFYDHLRLFYSDNGFLLFHTLLEFFSIAISGFIAILGWMTYPITQSKYALQLGAVFLAVGILDTAHTLVYNGMPFHESGNPSVWLWILARIIESIALLLIFLREDRGYKAKSRWSVYSASALTAFAVIFLVLAYLQHLPVLIVDHTKHPSGLKIGLEYAVSLLHLAIIGIILSRYKKSKKPEILTFALASFMIFLGELNFTVYKNIYDLNNVLGHVLKAAGYFFLLKGIYFATITEYFHRLHAAKTTAKEAESKYRTLVEHSLIGVYIEQDGKFAYSNPRLSELLGCPESNLIGKLVNDYILQRSAGEVLGRRKDGTILHLKLFRTDTRYNGRPATIGTLMDITETIKTEEMLRKADRLTAVSQLAAGVAHEVRNPLTVLKGFVQLLTARSNENNEYYELMLSEIQRIEGIITEFLVLAKPQTVHFEKRHMQKIVQEVIALVETKAIMSNVRIAAEINPDLPPIECEENQIKQVLINILQNAIESMEHGGLIEVKVEMNPEGQMVVSIIDQGSGIPEEMLSRLGEPYYSTKEKGTGLGLMISYRIIQHHQGQIHVVSKVNEGTRFDIVLPLTQGKDNRIRTV